MVDFQCIEIEGFQEGNVAVYQQNVVICAIPTEIMCEKVFRFYEFKGGILDLDSVFYIGIDNAVIKCDINVIEQTVLDKEIPDRAFALDKGDVL